MWGPEQESGSFMAALGYLGMRTCEIWGDGDRAVVDGGKDRARRQASFISNLLCLTAASVSAQLLRSVHVMFLLDNLEGSSFLGNPEPLGGFFVALALQLTFNSRVTLWSPHPCPKPWYLEAFATYLHRSPAQS